MARHPDPPSARYPGRVTPLWLAHHFPEDYDRCVAIGRRHVCRRCLALYPLSFAVLALTYRWHPPIVVDVVLVAGLPLPGVVEFVAEHLGAVRYSPRRQVAVTMVLAVGLGRGFARYLQDQTDPLFWSVVVVYGLVCGAAAWARQSRWAPAPNIPAMPEPTLFHNPRCSKSRGARSLLDEAGVAYQVVEYLKTPPTRSELEDLVAILDDPPAALVRTGEAGFKELGVDPAALAEPAAVVDLLAAHPELMERPVLVVGERAVIGRPPERVRDLLEGT